MGSPSPFKPPESANISMSGSLPNICPALGLNRSMLGCCVCDMAGAGARLCIPIGDEYCGDWPML